MSRPETRVLYNDSCPVCSREIAVYRRAAGDGVAFEPLSCAADWGLTEDQAARRLHVRQGGQVLSGVEAFRALWAAVPGWGWAARLAGLPAVRGLLALAYDRVAAPLLYRAHRRRQARGAGPTSSPAR
jgi:predicted DCC family thiol-disulfide oxidoreductase YuxK